MPRTIAISSHYVPVGWNNKGKHFTIGGQCSVIANYIVTEDIIWPIVVCHDAILMATQVLDAPHKWSGWKVMAFVNETTGDITPVDHPDDSSPFKCLPHNLHHVGTRLIPLDT